MTANERAGTPDIESQGLEDYEFVTLAGHTYTCVRLDEDGWKREGGFLERRQRQEPVSVERRRRDDDR